MQEDKPKQTKFDEAASKLSSLTKGGIRLSLIVLFGVASWRLAWSKFDLDFSKFDFSDLLAMILALFAMAMSVAFYFKSTDSSNQFYDNIYNFTQKTSEIFGRIEERFGERLRHLDEGYGRLQSHFDGSTNKSSDEIEQKVKEAEGKEKEEKEKLEETKRAMQELMETLAERAELQQQEKEEFYSKLEKLEAERNHAQERIREIEVDRDQLRRQLMMMEEGLIEDSPELLHHPFIREVIRQPEMRHLLRRNAPARIVQRHFPDIMSRFPEEIRERFRDAGIVNRGGEITPAGVLLLRTFARKLEIDL